MLPKHHAKYPENSVCGSEKNSVHASRQINRQNDQEYFIRTHFVGPDNSMIFFIFSLQTVVHSCITRGKFLHFLFLSTKTYCVTNNLATYKIEPTVMFERV